MGNSKPAAKFRKPHEDFSFLSAKLARMNSGEISHLTFKDYQHTTDRIIAQFGKTRLVSDLD